MNTSTTSTAYASGPDIKGVPLPELSYHLRLANLRAASSALARLLNAEMRK